MDIYGYHALVCKGHLLPRHNIVRDALFYLCQKACFSPIKDAKVTCLGYRSGQPSAFRPADLLIAGDDFDQDCLDVTVVSPIITNNQPEIVVGKKAGEAQKKKYQKHLIACESAGFGFKAFALDVFGIMAGEAKRFTHRLCSTMMRVADFPEYMAHAIVYRRISFSVQLGVARQFVACRALEESTVNM